jgi:hypothetical protein
MTDPIAGPDGGGPLLYAPASFWQAADDERRQYCNGCGAHNGLSSLWVPNSIYGLDASLCCDIHDWSYGEGQTIDDKDSADRAFLNNLLRMIEWARKNGSVVDVALAPLRRRRALKYYEAVVVFGGPAYWEGKNLRDEIGTVAEALGSAA